MCKNLFHLSSCIIKHNRVSMIGVIKGRAPVIRGFPGGTSGKEPACQCRRQERHSFNPWVGKIPWRRAWQPTLAFLPGEPPGQSREATVHRVTQSQTQLKHLSLHAHIYHLASVIINIWHSCFINPNLYFKINLKQIRDTFIVKYFCIYL